MFSYSGNLLPLLKIPFRISSVEFVALLLSEKCAIIVYFADSIREEILI